LNLIITCARHLEPESSAELRKILALFGDENPEIHETGMSGILIARTVLDSFIVIKKIKEKIIEEPWFIRYCLRIIPIQKIVNTNLKDISNQISSLMNKVDEKETFRITVEKRNSNLSTKEIISTIAKNIQNKVVLEKPDWIILIEILGDSTGISVLTKIDLFSLELSKRELLE